MGFSVETNVRIYNDDTGDYICVMPDSDSVGLVELIQYSNGKRAGSILLCPNEAVLLKEALDIVLQSNKIL